MATSNVDPDFLQQSRVPMIYAVTVTGYCVALLAVALRLFTRRLTKTRIWWDDFLIVASLVRSLSNGSANSSELIPCRFGEQVS